MPRLHRTIIPGVPMHVIQRGNNRTPLFLNGEDFALGRLILEEASKKFACAVHAYVLMGNHMHLLMTPADKLGPARMMQSIGIRYVRYFNHRYERTGTLWEGRYRAAHIQTSQHFLNCCRYIELNPIRANLVANPSDYPWSSFRHNALGRPDPIVTPHSLVQSMGQHPAERAAAYQSLFDYSLDPDACELIRSATNAGIAVGDENFQRKLERSTRRRMTFAQRGGDRRSPAYVSPAAVWKAGG